MANKNSIIGDTFASFLPKEKSSGKYKKGPKSDWAKLGEHRAYPQIEQLLTARQEYWRHYLPGGDKLAELAVENPEKAGLWAGMASIIVEEIDNIHYKIEQEVQGHKARVEREDD